MENTFSSMASNNHSSLDAVALSFLKVIVTILFPILLLPVPLFCLLRPRWEGPHQLPPGPKPWPIVGCLPEMLKSKPTYRWIHKLMTEANTEIACIRLGSVHVIAVTCPEISREFLKTQDDVFASRPMNMGANLTSKAYLTTLLVPLGDQWKKMRRILTTEILSPARHRWLHAKRVEEADHMIRYVYNQCKKSEEGGLVNVRVAAQHYCGNVIRKMVFNKRFFGEGMKDGGPGIEEEEHVMRGRMEHHQIRILA